MSGIVLDALHLVREGGTVADVRAMEPGLIRYVQLCDGPASLPPEERPLEASLSDCLPGEGVFPLVELLADAPTDIPWGIEAPSRHRAARGKSAEMQAKAAMAAVRGLIDKIPAAKKSLGR